MKRKDLYKYVREQIVNELKEGAAEDQAATAAALKNQQAQIAAATAASAAADAAKKAADTKKAETAADKKPGLTEDGVNELARKGRNIQMGENFATIKDAYAGSMIERILDVVEEAGEEGITPKNIMAAVGIKFSSVLNPIIGELIELGAVTGPAPKEAETEPEETTPEDDLVSLGIPKVTDNPEEEEDTKDDYYKPEEEDSTEEEPKDIAVSDKETEKIIGGKAYAKKLTPEEEDVINKYKNAITNKSKILKDKKASADDKAKAKAALDSYKKKDDLKKLFNKKGGKSLIDFINDELNK
jgi:hypothetical protein